MKNYSNFAALTVGNSITTQGKRLIAQKYLGFFYAHKIRRLPLRKLFCLRGKPTVNSVKCNRFHFDKVTKYNF
jgi:hypothetical protein